MLNVSSGFKKGILSTQSFAQLFAGGELRLFSGQRTASADRAEPRAPIGVVSRIDAGGPFRFVLVGTNVIKPVGDVWRFLATQPGSVAWWRLVGADDTGADTLTQARIDGDIGTEAAPNDLTLAQLTFNAGDTLFIDSFLYTIPPVGT